MSQRNTNISYLIALMKNTWFWLGVWVFYYLKFTNYSGIGLIESVLIITITITEIPTGAIADLLGKKKTLIIAFFLETLGSAVMANAQSLNHLLFSVFVMCVGGSLYSGTLEALIYDSLKQEGKESLYDKKISNINSLSLFAPALCSIIGGYLYNLNSTFPFWANTIGYFVGFIACFFLNEPKIDSETFSLKSFFQQNTKGVKELFKTANIKSQSILLLSIGFFVVISSEMLDSFLSVEFGFKPEQMGILWSIIFLVSAAASQLTPLLVRKLGKNTGIITVGVFMSISLIISPIIGLFLGGLILTFRASLQGIFGSLSSIAINSSTESRYRATTLSTFNMIKNIPYVLTAFLIGSISDTLSAKTSSMYLGLVLIALILIQIRPISKTSRNV